MPEPNHSGFIIHISPGVRNLQYITNLNRKGAIHQQLHTRWAVIKNPALLRPKQISFHRDLPAAMELGS